MPSRIATVLLALGLALSSLLIFGCGDDEKQQQTAPKATAPKEAAPPPAKPEPPVVQKKIWPFLSGDYKQPMADDLLARNFVLVFDGSGSMSEVECSGALTKCDAAKKAVVEWSATLPAGANLGLVSFHANSNGLQVEDLSAGDRTAFIKTIKAISPGGKTPLTNALKQAFVILEKQAQKQLGYGEYTVVVVTDGIANNPQNLENGVNYLLKYTPIVIYTIGFCIGEQHSLNQKGRTHYRAADNPEQLREGLRETLAETESFDQTEFK